MNIDEADALKVGDSVICTAAGISRIRYREGDVGTVRFKDGEFFAVTLSDGRETGITSPGNWEPWVYEERAPSYRKEQAAKALLARATQS